MIKYLVYTLSTYIATPYTILGITLAFLAVWHGFHSGYYLTFFYELLVMNFEKEVSIRERVLLILWNILYPSFLPRLCNYLNESNNSFSFQFFWMVDNSQLMQEMYKNTAFRIASKVLGKLYVLFFLPHCFMPFALLKHVYYLPGNNILNRILRIFSSILHKMY